MERRESKITVVRKVNQTLDSEHDAPLPPELALRMMWQLTCNAWAFMPDSEQPDDSIESRHQRFSRVFKHRTR